MRIKNKAGIGRYTPTYISWAKPMNLKFFMCYKYTSYKNYMLHLSVINKISTVFLIKIGVTQWDVVHLKNKIIGTKYYNDLEGLKEVENKLKELKRYIMTLKK